MIDARTLSPRCHVVSALLACLLLPTAGGGAVFTAGASGGVTTVQAALDAALALGGSNEVRVQQGGYPERLVVPQTFTGALTVTGGWNAAFTTRSTNPTLTVIDAEGLGSTLTVDRMASGNLRFEGLTLTGGFAAQGGGANIQLEGDAELALVNNRIVENAASDPSARGGGLWSYIFDSSHLVLAENLVAENVAQGDINPSGGGFALISFGNSTFSIANNRIEGNRVVSTNGGATEAGFEVAIANAGSGALTGNVVQGNECTGAYPSSGYGAHIASLVPSTGTVTARRNVFLDNHAPDETEFGEHVALSARSTGQLVFTDNVIAGGNRHGVGVDVTSGGTIRIANVTIARHQGIGLFDYRWLDGAPPAGTLSIFNTLVFGNGTETSLTNFLEAGFNLVGVDPLFAATNDYHLRAASPAVDAGTNAPPGGLSPSDADGLDRITGGTVDIGAFERQPAASCIPGDTVLCLRNGRFRVEIDWRTAAASGSGQAVELTGETGYFWFFNHKNVEVVVKVLNACGGFGHFWVFAAGLTNVAVEITVTDTTDGATRQYESPLGTPFQPLQDNDAFATCP